MRQLKEFIVARLRRGKRPLTTRSLLNEYRKTHGRKMAPLPHEPQREVVYADVDDALVALEREGLVERRGTPPEWRARP